MKIQHHFAVIIVTFGLLAAQAVAQPISYQGYLEQQVQPFSDRANLEFHLFAAASGGAQIGSTNTRSNWPIEESNNVCPGFSVLVFSPTGCSNPIYEEPVPISV